MDRFSRIVLGYHGCDPALAEALIRGELRIQDWQWSQNPYDWLGHGIYFWEFALHRAKAWGGKGGIVGAVIQLGNCLDFTDTRWTEVLVRQYKLTRQRRRRRQLPMPTNRGKRRDLDCLIINDVVTTAETEGLTLQTVRSPFMEGKPAFPRSGILRESHIQIAVRDRSCILGVFRPHL